MKTWLKKHAATILFWAILIGLFAVIVAILAAEYRRQPVVQTDHASTYPALYARDSARLAGLQASLDKQTAALDAALSKLKAVEWQLAVATRLQMERYDSLNAAFVKVAEQRNEDRELLEIIGE